MNKETVLEQMKQDNEHGDERARSIEYHSYVMAFKTVNMVCFLYFIIGSFTLPEHDHSRHYMLYPMVAGLCVYYFIKCRNEPKISYILGFIFYLIAVVFGTIWLFIDK